MSNHIELAKKLKALADKGIGGEKTTAEKMLATLLKKHKITIEQIDSEATQDYYFKLKNSEQRLLYQIIKHVHYKLNFYGEFPKDIIKKHGLKGNYMVTCTASQYIEIEAKHSFYKNLYEEEVSVFYSAFIRANGLLVDNPESKDDEEMSFEDYEKWKRVNDMAKNIKVGEFRKQIERTKK